MTALCLCFPLPSYPCLCLMCYTIQPLDTMCFERHMRGNDSFIRLRPGIQIPADLLITWLILQIFLRAGARLRLLGLSVEHGASVIISPVVTLCDNQHKLVPLLKMFTLHHLIQTSNQIRNCRDDSVI